MFMSDLDQNTCRDWLLSYFAEARDRALKSDLRFAHYTTSATAHLILKNQEPMNEKHRCDERRHGSH